MDVFVVIVYNQTSKIRSSWCLVMMTAIVTFHGDLLARHYTVPYLGHPIHNPPANPSVKINKSCMTEILVEAYSYPRPWNLSE